MDPSAPVVSALGVPLTTQPCSSGGGEGGTSGSASGGASGAPLRGASAAQRRISPNAAAALAAQPGVAAAAPIDEDADDDDIPMPGRVRRVINSLGSKVRRYGKVR